MNDVADAIHPAVRGKTTCRLLLSQQRMPVLSNQYITNFRRRLRINRPTDCLFAPPSTLQPNSHSLTSRATAAPMARQSAWRAL